MSARALASLIFVYGLGLANGNALRVVDAAWRRIGVRVLKRIVYGIALLVLCSLGLSNAARAQNPNPADLVFSNLVTAGFDVIEVGVPRDAQGSPMTDAAYVQMQTITLNVDDTFVVGQVVKGFQALAKYYPHTRQRLVVLRHDRWLLIFQTTLADWDALIAKRVKGADWWKGVRAKILFYDNDAKKYVTAKDFTTQNQTTKNQTNKDFTGQGGNNPLPPVNDNPNAQAENILLEPSTTFLPADGAAAGYLMATLTDATYAGLPGRGVNFTYEVRGQDEKALGIAQTDQLGTARNKIISSRALGLVLLRASDATLNASTQILVNAPPGQDVKLQIQAVNDGLASQGYRQTDADYVEDTGPTGSVMGIAVAQARAVSSAFDRAVYSQLSRMLGTMRTVMPNAGLLYPILLHAAADGHTYRLYFVLRADVWDAYVRGAISENQLWSNFAFVSAVDENGVRTSDRDFLSKNFTGAPAARYSSAPRAVQATLTNEAWGEQLTTGSFLIPVGGYADNFSVSELSGEATGFTLYESPDYFTPFFTYTRGDDAALKKMRLETGQYVLSVIGARAPAKLILSYTEHLGR
ncbi:MAG: hypothetical protein B6D41_05405 [Chloroflexi bacterium UTCFX4]|jgi:hypothetical protein|nr:MAG: hypothetical protein B6D41_05405 [Chloroflexi bacterium UTCFX4]